MHHREQWSCRVKWCDELDELIRERRKRGLSFSLIALEIGRLGITITRNAVIGRAQRKGISGMTTPTIRKPNSQGVRKGHSGNIGAFKRRDRATPPRKLLPVPATVEFLDLPIAELRRDQCRYWSPNTQGYPMLFCGQPTFDSAFCPTHHRLCYVKAR